MNADRLSAWTVVAVLLAGGTAKAQLVVDAISLDPASPTLVANSRKPADLLVPPGLGLKQSGTSLGLVGNFPGSTYDNLNALSYGDDDVTASPYFSVDRLTLGRPGTAVATASLTDSAAASIFIANLGNQSNTLEYGPGDLGLQGGFFGDDVDALAGRIGDPPASARTYFSLDLVSITSMNSATKLADNILLSSGAGSWSTFADGETTMGLQANDEIDALLLLDRGVVGTLEPGIDIAVISLSPQSPSTFTATGQAYAAGVVGRLSPADLLRTDFQGGFQLYRPAVHLGLFPADNVNALAVPEPSTPLTPLVGLVLALVGRQSKIKPSHTK